VASIMGSDFGCVDTELGNAAACQIQCAGSDCSNAQALCSKLAPKCKAIDLNTEKTVATLKTSAT
jgi:hypothetical protein